MTEYTMSEIIASVYEKMEQTGIREGILFIDEINCVSETLAPTMLQFLQGKTFGNQKLPEGWIIVAAGNPPEYNKSVREFDVVTLDRLKKIDVEPDFPAWKEYAYRQGIHPAVISYLELRRENFCRIENWQSLCSQFMSDFCWSSFMSFRLPISSVWNAGLCKPWRSSSKRKRFPRKMFIFTTNPLSTLYFT